MKRHRSTHFAWCSGFFLILSPHGPYVPSARVQHLIDEVIAPTSASLEFGHTECVVRFDQGLPDRGPVKAGEIGL